MKDPRASRLFVCLALALLAALALAACGGSGGSGSSTGGGGGATPASSAGKVDYSKLLTQVDARAISGHADATPMPQSEWGEMAGDDKYFAIFQSKDWSQGLWLRVAKASWFTEGQKAYQSITKIGGLGDAAYWYTSPGMERGIAISAGGTTYVVSSRMAYDKPELTDAQLMQAAKTVASRL
jgi:hypothetical protein